MTSGDDETVHRMMDFLGRLGAVWREADTETTDLETVIIGTLTFNFPCRYRLSSGENFLPFDAAKMEHYCVAKEA